MPEHTAREWTEDMGEISGFGGTYEAGCRAMVFAGMKWCDEHPDADPQFRGFKGVYGVISDENDDAKALTKAVIDAPITVDGKETTVGEYGATGAMHQAAISHVMFYRAHGWDEYCRQLRTRERDEATETER
jgi:hypothetical protein